MIVSIWGNEKSWKTSMALTWPKDINHFDLDVGGFERAAWRIDTSRVDSTSYPLPIPVEKLLGQQKNGISIKFPKKVVGIREVWQKIIMDFVEAVNNSNVKTIVMDSATQLWFICHRAYLQELQEKQLYRFTHDKDGNQIKGRAENQFPENEFRENLTSIEYAEPNSRMSTLIYTARSYGKNLILTHYPRDVYAQKVTDRGVESYATGDIEPDGFKHTRKLIDIEFWIEQVKSKSGNSIQAKITTCGMEGMGTAAQGLMIDPNYEALESLRKSMSGEE